MIVIFVPGNPRSSNASGQWARMATAHDRRKFRTLTKKIAKEYSWPNGVPPFVRVTARQISPVNRRRDPGGLAEKLKPLLDGLVDSGLLTDDNEDCIQLVLDRSEVVKKATPGIVLTLEAAPWPYPQTTNSSSSSPG